MLVHKWNLGDVWDSIDEQRKSKVSVVKSIQTVLFVSQSEIIFWHNMIYRVLLNYRVMQIYSCVLIMPHTRYCVVSGEVWFSILKCQKCHVYSCCECHHAKYHTHHVISEWISCVHQYHSPHVFLHALNTQQPLQQHYFIYIFIFNLHKPKQWKCKER